jgi:hypothetical protein
MITKMPAWLVLALLAASPIANAQFVANSYACGWNANANIGQAAAISGNWLYLGGGGQVQVFQYRGTTSYYAYPHWNHVATIPSPTGQSGDGFGSVVAVDGPTIVIGAPNATVNGVANAGRTFIYLKQQAKDAPPGTYAFVKGVELAAPSTQAALFGASVAISGDTIIVGEPHLSYRIGLTTHSQAGGAAIYQRNAGGTNEWGFTGTMAGSAESGDHFGAAVAISGSAILVGAPDAPVTPAGQSTINGGRGYFFTLQSDGTAVYSLYVGAQLPAAGHEFGAAVAVDGSIAVFGAPVQANDEYGNAVYPSVDIYAANGSGGYGFAYSTHRGFDAWAHSIAVAGTSVAVGYVFNNREGVDLLERNSTSIWDFIDLPVHTITSYSPVGAKGGTSVAFDGHTIVSGAPYLECGGNTTNTYGGAFVYMDEIFGNGFETQ